MHSALYAYTLFKGDAAGSEAEFRGSNDAVRVEAAAISGKIVEFAELWDSEQTHWPTNGMNEAVALRFSALKRLLKRSPATNTGNFAAETHCGWILQQLNAARSPSLERTRRAVTRERSKGISTRDFAELHLASVARGTIDARSGNSTKALESLAPPEHSNEFAELMATYARGVPFCRRVPGLKRCRVPKDSRASGRCRHRAPSVQILYRFRSSASRDRMC